MESTYFARLPLELRETIYELVLHRGHPLTIQLLTGTPCLIGIDRARDNLLALCSTCKQLQHESSSIFYKRNDFILIARPLGERYSVDTWQIGFRKWLMQIGERGRRNLSSLQIDVGTSYMYDYQPSSESIWRSVSGILDLLRSSTQVRMQTEVVWTLRPKRSFDLSLPLKDTLWARSVIDELLAEQRDDLEIWCQERQASAQDTSYRRMELETCSQELRGFINLVEITSNDRAWFGMQH